MNYNHEGLPIGIFHQMLKSILDQYYRGTKANKPLLVFIVQYFLVNFGFTIGSSCRPVLYFRSYCSHLYFSVVFSFFLFIYVGTLGRGLSSVLYLYL